ncbi:MAG: DUF502 domain-containing protein [bacterium]
MMQKISSAFFRGLVILLPLLITVWLLFFFYNFLDGILGNILSIFTGHHIPGLGFVLIIALILFAGLISPLIIGKKLIEYGDEIMNKVPIVKSIYSSVKQVNDVLFMKRDAQSFNRACLVEYPRHGIWSVGFVTSDAASEIEKKSGGHKMINIFIANTPTPATGFLIVVPSSDVKLLDMKIEEAFKYVVSGGVLKPKG